MEILAVIPARSGSIRLPGKNIKLLNGKPLIAYTIEAWNKSKYFFYSPFDSPHVVDRPALVFTDSDEISQIAQKYGARFLKEPNYLAKDNVPPHIWLQYIVESLSKYYQYRAGVIVLLQPTSPLRTATDIDACLDLYMGGQCDSVTSVCEGKENGAVYVTHAALVSQGSIYGTRLAKYEMPPDRSIDIDYLEDFDEAEGLLKKGETIGNSRIVSKLA